MKNESRKVQKTPPDMAYTEPSDAANAQPDWARFNATIERGMSIRVARERREVGLFVLTAAGILAIVWTPLLLNYPQAFFALQAVQFFGIALFYLPIHALRRLKGDEV